MRRLEDVLARLKVLQSASSVDMVRANVGLSIGMTERRVEVEMQRRLGSGCNLRQMPLIIGHDVLA